MDVFCPNCMNEAATEVHFHFLPENKWQKDVADVFSCLRCRERSAADRGGVRSDWNVMESQKSPEIQR